VDPPHKTGIAQAQHRHQPYQVTGELINIFKLQRFPFAVNKAAQSHHAIIIGKLPLQAVEHSLIAIVAGYPAFAERPIAADPMAARFIFTEGQNNMQMTLAPLNIPGRKPKIFPNKMIEIELRRQEQRQGIQQAGFTPCIFANQHVILLQHQR